MGILGPPYCGIGATINIGREMLCLPYAGFLGGGGVGGGGRAEGGGGVRGRGGLSSSSHKNLQRNAGDDTNRVNIQQQIKDIFFF